MTTVNRLKFLRNRHVGERCVLVANGPSLNLMDLSPLKQEICIGMNKIFLGFRKFGFYPHYYVAINGKVIRQSLREINALTAVKLIGTRGASGLIQENALTYLVDTDTPGPRFSTDLVAQGLEEGHTVTYAALQVAYYLGFSEVAIIGMDHRYRYDGAPNRSKIMEGPDPNHFCAHYFAAGQIWDNPNLAGSEVSYRRARRAYERAGRRIVDATLDGACTVFEKVNFREYLGAVP